MKKIFIAGGTHGFGICLAKAFSKKYDVIINGRVKVAGYKTIIKDMVDLTVNDLKKHNPYIIINNGFDKEDYFHSYKASINVLKNSYEFFKEKKTGKIINVNSVYGIIPDSKDPDYAAAKHGLKGYSDSISAEAYKNNIQILNIYPRAMAVGINAGRLDFNELINPDEVAEFIVNMCNTKSFYISSIQFDRIGKF